MHQGNGSVVPFPKTDPPYARVLGTLVTDTTGSYIFTRGHGQDRFYFQPITDTLTTTLKLTKIADRNNYTTTLAYDTSGWLATVTDPAGRALTFTHSLTNGLITRVQDPADRTVSFAYDGNGDLQVLTDVVGLATHFTYSNHRLLTMTAPNGGVVQNAYNVGGQVISQTDALTRTLLFAYTSAGIVSTTTITNPLGYTTTHTYNQNRLIQVTGVLSGEVATWQYAYNGSYPTGITAATDPLNHTWRYEWDTQGNLLRATDPLTRTTRYAYNSTNDPVVVTNALGIPITYTYDISGNLTTIARPLTQTNEILQTSFAYDPAHPGDVLTVTNPLTNSWTMAYDTYGYVLSTTNPLTQTTRYAHDPIGRLLSVTSPRIYTTSFAYTLDGLPTQITDTLGYTTTYAYDGNRNLTTITDTRGLTTTYTYDLGDTLTRITRPDGTHSDYAYDLGGRLITQTNGLGQSTRYGYDSFNRVISVQDPLTRTAAYAYDLANRPLVITDAQGLTTTLGYDSANQVLSVTYGDGGTTPNVAWAYNDLGMRTVMTDGTGTSSYTYDSLNRPTRIQNGAGRRVSYGYDRAGQLTALGYPGFSSPSAVLTSTRSYDPAGQLTGVSDWLAHTTSFSYNADGALTRLTYPNGVAGTVGRDAADAVSSVGYSQNVTTLFAETYTRDPAGLLKTASDSTATHSYQYDRLDRLTGDGLSTGQPVSRTWTYDGAYQITQTNVQNGIPTNGTRTYNAGNQLLGLKELQGLTTTQDGSFTYSPTGNRTMRADKLGGPTRTYGYDQANRLTSYGALTSYGYNGDGLRMSKSSGLATTQYTWDAAAGLPVLLQEGSTSYLYGPGGMILEQVNGSTPVYYHADQLGSVRATTDGSGALTAAYTYDAYGTATSPTQPANGFGYTGEYIDSESGLYYLRARYYDPATQQFLTRDPLVALTEQAYGYVAGSPLNATDPSGLYWRYEGSGGDYFADASCMAPSDDDLVWDAVAGMLPGTAGQITTYAGGVGGAPAPSVVQKILKELQAEKERNQRPKGYATAGPGQNNQFLTRAWNVVRYADANGGAARPGYRGNTPWANDGRQGGQVLSQVDATGNPISYTEYDVNPYTPGVNRGQERVVIGTDGSAYYTNNHYLTFTQIR